MIFLRVLLLHLRDFCVFVRLLACISYILYRKCIDRLLEYVRKLHVRMQGASLATGFRKIVCHNSTHRFRQKLKSFKVMT